MSRAGGLRFSSVTGITRYVSSDASSTSAEASADALLRRLGAPTLAHPGGSLHEHLWRVHAVLEAWGASRPVRLAGLCHAVYGTAGFDSGLLPPTTRAPLVDAIGRRAEALVHLYASCDRADFYPRLEQERPPRFRDRFTGRERVLPEASLRALVEITAANELDVLHHDERFRASHGDALRRLFTASADLLSPQARAAWGLAGPEQEPTPLTVTRIDHLVLTVSDIARSIEFYEGVLGMRAVTFGDGRRALEFGQSKINLHLVGNEITPHAARPVPGSADLCLVTDRAMEVVVDHMAAWGIPIEEGPVRRTGAMGPVLSCYVRDPDGNLVEVSTYGPQTAAESQRTTS